MYRAPPAADAPPPPEARARAVGLWAAYGDAVVLRDVNLSLDAGRIYGLVGPNGAGKSTLMRCLAGLHPTLRGEARVEGGRVALMPDTPPVWERLSVREQLLFAARIDRGEREDVGAQADAWLARVGLGGHRHHPVRALSLGQRQRLGLAQVMLQGAALVMLDEPANGMDPDARAMLADVLREAAARGVAVLVSSHVLSELDTLCDAFVVLARGRVAASGTAHELHGAEAGTVTVAVRLLDPAEGLRATIAEAAGASPGATLSQLDGNVARVQVSDDPAAQAALLRAMIEAGLPVVSFSAERPHLASLYGHLSRRDTETT